MWTGRQTLASIERVSSDLHGEEGRLDVALRSAVSEAARLRKERSAALQELARVKLDEMEAGRLMRDLAAGSQTSSTVGISTAKRVCKFTHPNQHARVAKRKYALCLTAPSPRSRGSARET
jgi:hypothetical protein